MVPPPFIQMPHHLLVHLLDQHIQHLTQHPLHVLDKPKHPHDLNLTLEHLWHGDGHHMLTLVTQQANQWNTLSRSWPLSP